MITPIRKTNTNEDLNQVHTEYKLYVLLLCYQRRRIWQSIFSL